MPARRTRIGCLLAGVFVLSIPDYGDTALARPAHQVSREGKNQSQIKSEKVDGVRPRASVRGPTQRLRVRPRRISIANKTRSSQLRHQ